MASDNRGLMGCPEGVLYHYHRHCAVSGRCKHSHLLPGWYRLSIDVGGASSIPRQAEKLSILSGMDSGLFYRGIRNRA